MKFSEYVLHPPVFDDHDKTRVAALLHFILLSTIMIVLIEVLAHLFVTHDSFLLQINLIALPVFLGLFILMRSGRVRWSAFMLVIFLWLIISFICYSSTGILNPVFGAQTLTIVIGGLLINGSVALGTAGLSSLFGLWLVQAAEAGKYADSVGSVAVGQAWVTDTAFFTLIALFMILSLRVIRETHARAVREERRQRHELERYRLLVENAPGMIATIDREHHISFVNRVPNGNADRVQGRSVYEFIAPEWQDAYRETLKRVFEQGSNEQLEMQTIQAEGQFVWSLIHFAPLWVRGQVGEVIVISTDVTERKRADAALRESEARLDGIIESAMDAIISIDEGQHIVQFNAGAETMFQCKSAEVIGQSISRFIPERFRETHEESIHMFGRNGVTNRRMGALSALKGLRTNGEEFSIEASISQIEIEGHKFYTVILRDITERLRSEEALKRSEALFSSIYQTVPVAIGIVSLARGKTISTNNYMLQLTGYEADQIIEKPIAAAPYWLRPDQWQELVPPVIEDGSVNGVEMEWRSKDGTILHMIGSAAQIEIDGEACLLGIALDISDRKQAEKDRIEAEKLRLEVYKERDVLELKERFISTMSHQFRTPLAVILGAKESLQFYYDRMKPERREEHFRNVDEQVRYLTLMLDDVLTLGKARAGKLQFNPAPLDLVPFCQKLFEQLQSTDLAQHQFAFINDGQIGEIAGDVYLLQHILINLLSNAIKYSPEGSEVRIELSRHGDEAVMRVSDQGIGIPEEDQKHLFEPFYRASNTSTIKGTGLGLAIMKESAEIHGGTIGVESLPGKGTTFTVHLPISASLKNPS